MQGLTLLAICALAVAASCWSAIVLLRQVKSSGVSAILLAATLAAVVFHETRIGFRGPAAQATILAAVVVLGVGALLLDRKRWRSKVGGALFVPAALSAWLFITNALGNPDLSFSDLFTRFAPVAFWVVLALVFGSRPPGAAVVAHSASLAMSVSVLGSLFVDPWRPCDQFKCGVFDGIFTGPFTSENYLARIASLALILLLTTRLGKGKAFSVALAVLILVAATSRTAGLSVVAAVLIALLLSRVGLPALRAIVLVLAVGGAVVSASIVASAQSSSFSNRGWIWRSAITAIGDQIWLGLGIDRWSQLQAVGALPPNNFPHNQLILLTFAGGIIACLIYMISLASLATRGVAEVPTTTLAILIFLLVAGITEVIWNPATLDGHTFPLIILLGLAADGASRFRAKGQHMLESSRHELPRR